MVIPRKVRQNSHQYPNTTRNQVILLLKDIGPGPSSDRKENSDTGDGHVGDSDALDGNRSAEGAKGVRASSKRTADNTGFKADIQKEQHDRHQSKSLDLVGSGVDSLYLIKPWMAQSLPCGWTFSRISLHNIRTVDNFLRTVIVAAQPSHLRGL